jgi:hypothetical protein
VSKRLDDMQIYDDTHNAQTCTMSRFINPEHEFGREWREVYFPFANHPDLLAGDHIGVWISGGLAHEIMILTGGIDIQSDCFAQLSEKFGRPTTLATTPVQNRMGAKFDVIHAR